jgi:hypothetical protein
VDRVSADSAAPNEWNELAEIAAATDPALRARVAAQWTKAARYEHASIASFDRFALQLLALGAPPALLQGAHHAALDEIEHARLSFRVASIYEGRPLGPGPLPIEPPVLADFSLEKIVFDAVEEGCVGETLAAAHAELLLEHVQGRALHGVFAVIQRDEAKHAALAYQFTRWALGAFGDAARRTVERSFETSIAKLKDPGPSGPSEPSEPELWRHGLLNDHDRHVANLRALREVVEPVQRELLRPATRST